MTSTAQGAVLYTAHTHTTGGRNGEARSSDGRLDIKLSLPGATGTGTNPEQLFAAGWSACFLGAMERVARSHKVIVPADAAVDAEILLCHGEGCYFLRARLTISLPGVDPQAARALIADAHRTCPYSRATAGNIDVETALA